MALTWKIKALTCCKGIFKYCVHYAKLTQTENNMWIIYVSQVYVLARAFCFQSGLITLSWLSAHIVSTAIVYTMKAFTENVTTHKHVHIYSPGCEEAVFTRIYDEKPLRLYCNGVQYSSDLGSWKQTTWEIVLSRCNRKYLLWTIYSWILLILHIYSRNLRVSLSWDPFSHFSSFLFAPCLSAILCAYILPVLMIDGSVVKERIKLNKNNYVH